MNARMNRLVSRRAVRRRRVLALIKRKRAEIDQQVDTIPGAPHCLRDGLEKAARKEQ